jgi:hypothetical protein
MTSNKANIFKKETSRQNKKLLAPSVIETEKDKAR